MSSPADNDAADKPGVDASVRVVAGLRGRCRCNMRDFPPLLALLCSGRCPGNLVLLFYELARRLRDEGIATIGGFHTPMEQDALEFLIRGRQPVVWVPSWSRSTRRLSASHRKALDGRGLVMVDIFNPPVRRPSRRSGKARNNWVIDHADAVLVIHANAGGMTEQTARKATTTTKPVWALEDAANNHLSPIPQITIDHLTHHIKQRTGQNAV